MFEFLEIWGEIWKGALTEMDTRCVWQYGNANTLSILISLPSRHCDWARFFLLMHFTATCQSRFCNKKGTHECQQTRHASTAEGAASGSCDLPLCVCPWTQQQRRRDQSDPSCWTQTSRQPPWSTQWKQNTTASTWVYIRQTCPVTFPCPRQIPLHMSVLLKGPFERKRQWRSFKKKKNNTRNQNVIKVKLKSNVCSELPWHPGQVSYLRDDCFRRCVRYYCPRPTYGSFS